MPDNHPPPRNATDLVAELSDAWLFAKGSEGIVLVDAAGGTVIAANPAAALLLRTARPRLLGARFAGLFRDEDATPIKRAESRARAGGRARLASVMAREGDIGLGLTFSTVRSGQLEYQIVRLQRSEDRQPDTPRTAFQSVVFETLEAATESFVVTDLAFRIEYANPAFHSLVGLARTGLVVGHPLMDWLKIATADRDRLARQIADREAVATLAVDLKPANGPILRVEVRAVCVPDGDWPCWGFILQECGARKQPVTRDTLLSNLGAAG